MGQQDIYLTESLVCRNIFKYKGFGIKQIWGVTDENLLQRFFFLNKRDLKLLKKK